MNSWQRSERVGPYVLLESLGASGMGEVWKARDTRVDRTVAIKRLKSEHIERFKQEARTIASLNHPHICQLYDVGDDYLVMEYVDGAPLQCPQPAEEAIRLALQIADARMARVVLRPELRFSGAAPDAGALAAMHDKAHHACFIANSVKTTVTVEAAE